MFNLLPEQEKKQIIEEYKARRAIITLVFVFAIGLIGVISIFPAYVLSSGKSQNVVRNIEAIRNSSIFQEEAELSSKLSEANLKLLALKPPKTQGSIVSLFSSIIGHKNADVRIDGFMYSAPAVGAAKITVHGIARGRQNLSSFVAELKKDPFFTKVDLPVSSFTKDQNADFSLDITGTF